MLGVGARWRGLGERRSPAAQGSRGPRDECSTGNALDSSAAIESARRLLREGLGELSLRVGEEQVGALLHLARLLERWSRRINLTGHRTLEDIVRRLVIDAAALCANLPWLPSLADLGSGAGFPGLPLAILRPECEITLVEARARRHHFQRAVVRELGLRNARLKLGRAEAIEPQLHAAVVAQAMARPDRALRWMLPWAAPGGLILLPGSASQPQVPELAGVLFDAWVRYRVPCGGPERGLWVGRRVP